MKYTFCLRGLTFCSLIAHAQGIEVVVEDRTAESQLEQDLLDQQEEILDLDTDEIDQPSSDARQPETSSPATEDLGSAAISSAEPPIQSGPLVDLLGPILLSLEYTGSSTAALKEHYTTDALRNKKVIGLYFSADWCGPCRKFTPELVKFYQKMNSRRGRKDEFQIVWISRCRDVQSYGQYFTEMPWIALPPQEAMGERGEKLGKLYVVKGIPSLVLLDDFGSVINKDGRNMIPKDKAGIGFPWRNPVASLYVSLVPRSVRFIIKKELGMLKEKTMGGIKNILGFQNKKKTATKQT
ncbi:hypothetical protein ACA910_000224 [Epithemia clementina (nom. ined.)]